MATMVEQRRRSQATSSERSPASSRSMKANGLPLSETSQFLGWFGIGLGIAEVLAPNMMAKVTGVRRPGLLQLFGLREIAAGIGILYGNKPSTWMWGRVVGDALDLGALGVAMAEGDEEDCHRACASAVAVAGVTVMDVICARKLSGSDGRTR